MSGSRRHHAAVWKLNGERVKTGSLLLTCNGLKGKSHLSRGFGAFHPCCCFYLSQSWNSLDPTGLKGELLSQLERMTCCPVGKEGQEICGYRQGGGPWGAALAGSASRGPFPSTSPCRLLTGIAAFSSELLLTSGITLHVHIFVKTAVQHKDKKSGIFSGRTCGFSCRRAPRSPGRLGCKLGGGSACGRGCPRVLGLVIFGYL